jgi:hypothetical protein
MEEKDINTKSSEEKKVTVEKDVLEKLVSTVENIKKQNEEKDNQIKQLLSDNEMLKFAADKGRVARYQAQHADFSKKEARASFYNGKLIVGWRMLEDTVQTFPNSNLVKAVQTVEVFFEDGLKEKMDYAEFSKIEKVMGIVVEDTMKKDENGVESRFITLEVDGKRLPPLDIVFIN